MRIKSGIREFFDGTLDRRILVVALSVICLWSCQAGSLLSAAKSAKPQAVEETASEKQAHLLCESGSALSAASRYEEAIAKYREALAASPGYPAAVLGLGMCLYNQKRYYAALEQLDQAVVLNPGSSDAWLTLARTLQNMNKLERSIAAYGKYVAMVRDPDEKSKYVSFIDVLKSQAGSKQNEDKSAGAGHNYLSDATATGTSRWPGAKCSIPYYVEPPDSVPGYKPEFDELLRQAFSEWADASAGKIDFVRVDAPPEHGIKVTWTNDLHAPELRAEAGLTQCQSDGQGITSAHIQLLTVPVIRDQPVTNFTLHNICLHEIGHALGIAGHSPDKDDIMYPACSLQTGISKSDRNTLALLYADDPEQAAKQAEATAYPKRQFTRAEQCEKLTLEGTRLAIGGKNLEAMAKLKEALKIDPGSTLARQNISVAANNLGIDAENAGNQKLASSYFRQSLYFDPKCDASRQNLANLLQSQGLDVKSFAVRLKLAQQCESEKDLLGAIVEYSEALTLKKDPITEKHLQQIKAAYQAQDKGGTISSGR